MPDYPECPACGESDWTRLGGTMAPSFSFSHVRCVCGQTAVDLSNDGWHLFLVNDPDVLLLDTEQDEAFGHFLNVPLRLVARDYKAKWQKALAERDDQLYRGLLRQWGLDADAGVRHHFLGDQKYTNDKGRERSDFEYRTNDGTPIEMKDKYAFEKASRDLWQEADKGRRPGLHVPAPAPVQVPAGLTVYVRRPEGLSEPFTGPTGGDLPVDPLRKSWDDYWPTVWAGVTEATGVTVEPVETDNGYYNDVLKSEPWWTFEVQGTEFTVGPRKRVINLTMRNEKGIPFAPMKAVGEADSVTFSHTTMWEHKLAEVRDRLRDGDLDKWAVNLREARKRLQEEDPTPHLAKAVTLHAWGQDKAIEYLTLMVREAQNLSPAS